MLLLDPGSGIVIGCRAIPGLAIGPCVARPNPLACARVVDLRAESSMIRPIVTAMPFDSLGNPADFLSAPYDRRSDYGMPGRSARMVANGVTMTNSKNRSRPVCEEFAAISTDTELPKNRTRTDQAKTPTLTRRKHYRRKASLDVDQVRNFRKIDPDSVSQNARE